MAPYSAGLVVMHRESIDPNDASFTINAQGEIHEIWGWAEHNFTFWPPGANMPLDRSATVIAVSLDGPDLTFEAGLALNQMADLHRKKFSRLRISYPFDLPPALEGFCSDGFRMERDEWGTLEIDPDTGEATPFFTEDDPITEPEILGAVDDEQLKDEAFSDLEAEVAGIDAEIAAALSGGDEGSGSDVVVGEEVESAKDQQNDPDPDNASGGGADVDPEPAEQAGPQKKLKRNQ